MNTTATRSDHHIVVVVAPGGTHLSHVYGGATVGRSECATPSGSLSDLSFLLTSLGSYHDAGAERTVFLAVDPTMAGPDAITGSIRAHGWRTADARGGWWTIRRDDAGTIHLGVGPYLTDDDLVGGDPLKFGAWSVIADRLTQWIERTGVHYRYTAGVATLAAMQHAVSPKVRWSIRGDKILDAFTPPAQLAAINYTGSKNRRHRLARWDKRKAYLAAMAGADLPYEKMRQSGTDPLSGVGYFRVLLPGGSPFPWWPKPDRQGCVWIGGSRLALLQNQLSQQPNVRQDYQYPYELIDSVTAERPGRYLRGWAEQWRDLIDNDDLMDGVRGTAKAGYSQAIGIMGSPTPGAWRPDVRHMLVDYVNADIDRRALRVFQLMNLWPSRIRTDSISYALPDSHSTDTGIGSALNRIDNAIGVGDQMGRMVFEGWES